MRYPHLFRCAILASLVTISRPAIAQLTLADDVIIAAQGEAEKERLKRGQFGRAPGAPSPLFGSSFNPMTMSLTAPRTPAHREFLQRSSRPSGSAMSRNPEQDNRGGSSLSDLPSLNLPPPIPETPSTVGVSELLRETPGPPGGLTLDQAVSRLITANHELRTKFHEITMAQADVLTASLRENPLLFYDSTDVPYGSYSAERPGEVHHGLAIIYPIDYTGKRKARIAASTAAKRVREAQYQDAVRLEIDALYACFVDVLEARDAVQRAMESRRSLEQMMSAGQPSSGQDDAEALLIDLETTSIRLENEQKHLLRAKQVLAERLAIPAAQAASLEPYGSMRDDAPRAPSTDELIQIALNKRPDVQAHRLGLPHALAELDRAKAERMPNAYLLYSPFNYTDRRAPGELDSRTWGAGIFLPLPIYDRNQGNVKRSEINVSRTQDELITVERQVVTEVEAAAQEYHGTRNDLERLERVALPLIEKQRQQARDRFRAGKINQSEYLQSINKHSGTIRHYRELRVRHRRSMLDLNTAVGCRILP